MFQLEEGTVLAELLADDQFEGAFRALKLITLMFQFFQAFHDAVSYGVVLGDAGIDFPYLVENHAPTGDFAHQETALTTDQFGVDVFKGLRSLVDPVDVHAALVGEGAVADVRVALIERHVGDGGDVPRDVRDVLVLIEWQALEFALD